jgi:methionine-S-sulfoxide reductase
MRYTSTLLLISLLLFYPAITATSDPLAPQNHVEKATFAGGCFWCMQPPFDKLKGVISTKAGYTGGQKLQPTYNEVSAGGTGHAESVLIEFDPSKISYQQLLDVFWRQIDPTDAGGQFVDRGSQYLTVIFYHNEKQRQLAEQSRDVLETSGRFGKSIVTRIVPAATFWSAEEYHQHYADKNPIRYHFYRYHSGRDQYLDRIWGNNREH